MNYSIWTPGAREANEILRRAQNAVRYPWAWRKLRRARIGLIDALPVMEDLDWDGSDIVINADLEELPKL